MEKYEKNETSKRTLMIICHSESKELVCFPLSNSAVQRPAGRGVLREALRLRAGSCAASGRGRRRRSDRVRGHALVPRARGPAVLAQVTAGGRGGGRSGSSPPGNLLSGSLEPFRLRRHQTQCHVSSLLSQYTFKSHFCNIKTSHYMFISFLAPYTVHLHTLSISSSICHPFFTTLILSNLKFASLWNLVECLSRLLQI